MPVTFAQQIQSAGITKENHREVTWFHMQAETDGEGYVSVLCVGGNQSGSLESSLH